MAVITKNQAIMEFPLVISRQYGASIERYEVFYDQAEAVEYAKNSPLAYVGQTIKVVDEVNETVNIYTIKNKAGDFVQQGTAEHTHSVDDIITTDEKQFISKAEKEKLENTYTKPEIDERLAALSGGLEFKGVYATLAELETAITAPEDGYFAIITNDPAGKGNNFIVIYESTEPAGWKQLGDLLVPGIATESSDGLMSSAMVAALNQAGVDIEALKAGTTLPVATADKAGIVKIGANITVEADGTISTHAQYVHPDSHPATMIVEDADHRFVTDAEKTVYLDKYTKAETDQAIEGAINQAKADLTTAYTDADSAYKAEIKTVDDKVVAMDTAYKAADTAITEKVTEVETAYKAADTALETKVTAAETAISSLETAVEEVQATVSTNTATEDDVDSLFA